MRLVWDRNHRTDPRLAPQPSHQRAQQHLDNIPTNRRQNPLLSCSRANYFVRSAKRHRSRKSSHSPLRNPSCQPVFPSIGAYSKVMNHQIRIKMNNFSAFPTDSDRTFNPDCSVGVNPKLSSVISSRNCQTFACNKSFARRDALGERLMASAKRVAPSSPICGKPANARWICARHLSPRDHCSEARRILPMTSTGTLLSNPAESSARIRSSSPPIAS